MSTIIKEHAPQVLARPEHPLSRSLISSNALKVMYRLQRAGYDAYLVGGAVRDILLGGTPKDFDIGTNARPQEIRRLFRNSRIIGRRFRLVHVLFRGETVEVSTFRASADAHDEAPDWDGDEEVRVEEEEQGAAVASEAEDSFGTPEEDARRRDFTINGLFYNIADFSVIDLVGGLADLDAKVIRTIGVPELRFVEDPVRIMRGLEYSIRLGFSLDPDTDKAMHECSSLITEASSARLSYELLEALRSGHAAGIVEAWHRYGLIGRAFPDLDEDRDELATVLVKFDELGEFGAGLPDASLMGALFLPRFVRLLERVDALEGRFDNTLLLNELRDLLEPAASRLHLAKHTAHLMYHGLFSLTKLRKSPSRGRQVLKLVRRDYFPVAWDLFNIAVGLGYFTREPLRAWGAALDRVTRHGESAELEKKSDGDQPATARPRRRRRSRRRRKG